MICAILHIPTGLLCELGVQCKESAEEILADADFYFGKRGPKYLNYTWYKQRISMLYYREYIPREHNKILLELLELKG